MSRARRSVAPSRPTALRPRLWETNLPRATSIDTLRARIDRIDDQVLTLLNQRARLAIEIGQRKHRTSASIYTPAREKKHRRALGSPEHRAADGRQSAADLSRDHLGLPVARAAVAHRVPRAGGDLFAPGGARAVRGAERPATGRIDRRGVRRGRASTAPTTASCRWRTPPRAWSPLRSTGSSARRSASRPKFCCASSNTCYRAAAQRHACGASCRIRSRSGSAASGWRSIIPDVPLVDVASNAQAAVLARGDARVAAIAGGCSGRALRPAAHRRQHPGPGPQLHPLPGRRPRRRRQAERRRQDVAAVAPCAHEAGALHRVLAPFADNQRQHHHDRVAAAKGSRLGVPLLFGPGRARRGAAHRRGAGRAAATLPVAQGAGLLPASRCDRWSTTMRIDVPGVDRRTARAVSAGQADRGARARVRHLRLDQARLEREPARAVAEGVAAIAARASARCTAIRTASCFYLQRAARPEARRLARVADLRQRLQRDHRARRAHVPAARRRSGHGRSGVRHLPPRGAGGRRAQPHRAAAPLHARPRGHGRRDHPGAPASCSSPTRTTRPAPSSCVGRGTTSSPPCRAHVLVVMDEAYFEFVDDPEYPEFARRRTARTGA